MLQPTSPRILELINEYDEAVRDNVPSIITPLSVVYQWGEQPTALTLVYRHHSQAAAHHRDTRWIYTPIEDDTINLFMEFDQAKSLALVRPKSGIYYMHIAWWEKGKWLTMPRATYSLDIRREYGSRRLLNYATQ